MNYSELVQAIQDYAEYTEATFVSQIPTFVRQAEERINRAVKLPELRKNSTSATTSGDPYLARPSDFLTAHSLAVVDGSGNYNYLLRKDVNFIREAFPASATSGLPQYYAQFDGDGAASDGNFILGPTPDANYTVEIHYQYDPQSIVDAGTSWLGDNAETALLYGALIEAYVFMKGEPDIIAEYTKRYDEALSLLATVGANARSDSYRNGDL